MWSIFLVLWIFVTKRRNIQRIFLFDQSFSVLHLQIFLIELIIVKWSSRGKNDAGRKSWGENLWNRIFNHNHKIHNSFWAKFRYLLFDAFRFNTNLSIIRFPEGEWRWVSSNFFVLGNIWEASGRCRTEVELYPYKLLVQSVYSIMYGVEVARWFASQNLLFFRIRSFFHPLSQGDHHRQQRRSSSSPHYM